MILTYKWALEALELAPEVLGLLVVEEASPAVEHLEPLVAVGTLVHLGLRE